MDTGAGVMTDLLDMSQIAAAKMNTPPRHVGFARFHFDGRREAFLQLCLNSGLTVQYRAVLFEAACRGHSNSQVARPRSSPITHSLGCASTRLTKALPARIRLSISIREYNVGFTVRCNRFVAGSRAANRSACPTFSLITMRSIS